MASKPQQCQPEPFGEHGDVDEQHTDRGSSVGIKKAQIYFLHAAAVPIYLKMPPIPVPSAASASPPPSSLHQRQHASLLPSTDDSPRSASAFESAPCKDDSYMTHSQTVRRHWHPFLLAFVAISLLVATILQINSKRRHDDPPTSYIDWCEVNYHRDSGGWMVAELWNTISNAAYVFVGLYTVTMANRYKFLGSRFVWLGGMLVSIGLASALFHATLLWQTQNIDEAAETAALITFFHMGVTVDVTFWRMVVAHTLIASMCIVAIQLFTEFHLFSMVMGLIVRYEPEIKLLHPSTNAYTHLLRSAAFGVLGFASWGVDRAACEFLYGSLPFNPQLHAWWHLLTAYALHEVSLVAAAWKASQNGHRLVIHTDYALVTYISHEDSKVLG